MMTLPSPSDLPGCLSYYQLSLLNKGFSPHTADMKRPVLMAFFDWLALQCISDANKISVTTLNDYLGYLRIHRIKCNGKPLADSTIRQRITTVRVFLRALYRADIITNTSCEKFELPRMKQSLPKPILSYEDVLAVIKQVPTYTITGLRDRAMIECFYAAGLRRRELICLNLNDIDNSARLVRVVNSKGGKDRYVPVGEIALSWIRKYLRDSRPELITPASQDALFLSNRGDRFNPTQLSSLMSKYIRRANVNKFGSCHQYRHAAATHMFDRDADIRLVQEYLGHASISTTQIYLHISKARLMRVYDVTHPRAQFPKSTDSSG